MHIPLVDLKSQYKDIESSVNKEVLKVLREGDFILGKSVDKFEKKFADYIGVKYCIGVASGTDALLLSLKALGVGKGDEVITVPNTFIATVFPIILLGARPVFVDIDPKTYQIDTEKLKETVTKKTKVILPVHLFGIPANMKEILSLARSSNISVLEDTAQAHGSSIESKKCGSFGDISAFSFYPGKNLGAAGDGGAVVTNSARLANLIKSMRNIGQSKKYKHDIFGFNSRLDSLQAAVLLVKLKLLDKWNTKRRSLANKYKQLLKDLPIILPPDLPTGFLENFHLYIIRTKKREKLMDYLKSKKVFCGIHYPIPVHLQKSLKYLGFKKGDFPITEKYANEVLSLPIFPQMSEEQVFRVSSLIHKFFKK